MSSRISCEIKAVAEKNCRLPFYKVKIFRGLALLYQYVYYWMLEIDRNWLPETTSRYKAYLIYSVVQMLGLSAIYVYVFNVILGFSIHDRNDLFEKLLILIEVVALFLLNRWLLGHGARTQYYKEIFDGWNKWKRARWKLYVVFFSVSITVIFFLVVQVSRRELVL